MLPFLIVVVFDEGSQGLFFLVSQFGCSKSIVLLVMNYGQLQLKKKKKGILWLRMNRKMNLQSFSYCLIPGQPGQSVQYMQCSFSVGNEIGWNY